MKLLVVLVVAVVVTSSTMDLGKYEITWDSPVPSRGVVTLQKADEAVVATSNFYLDTSAVPVTSPTVPSTTVVLTTPTTTTFVPSTGSSTVVTSSPRVLTGQPIDNPLGSALSYKQLSESVLDNLVMPSVMETASGDKLANADPSFSNSTLDELAQDLLRLEGEVDSLNLTLSNDTNLDPSSIWKQVAEFLTTPDGLAFFVTVVILGKTIFSAYSQSPFSFISTVYFCTCTDTYRNKVTPKDCFTRMSCTYSQGVIMCQGLSIKFSLTQFSTLASI